jgi:hypothetical protein
VPPVSIPNATDRTGIEPIGIEPIAAVPPVPAAIGAKPSQENPPDRPSTMRIHVVWW